MMSSNAYTMNSFYWITWIHSLLMKFGQFMSYYKRENFIKKFYKYCSLETSSRLSCLQRIKHNLYWNTEFLKQGT